MTKKESDKYHNRVSTWIEAWTNSALTIGKKSVVISNVSNWGRPEPHCSYIRLIYILVGGHRVLLNKYKKL